MTVTCDETCSSTTRRTDVTLINHASVQVVRDNVNILFDPWYWGSAFNDSWRLLQEGCPNLQRGITHVLISHEHPDHLSFETLRRLKEEGWLSPACTLIFPARKERSIAKAIAKIGIAFREIERGKDAAIQIGDIVCAYYGEKEAGDHSIVLKCPDITILNQNDHYTHAETCRDILADWGRIDMFFTQFSLAGYYGNKDCPEDIRTNGTGFHLRRIDDYVRIFRPQTLCPFASLVYFCDEFNAYLNSFVVTPSDLLALTISPTTLQLLVPGNIVLEDDAEAAMRTRENAALISRLFDIDASRIHPSPRAVPRQLLQPLNSILARNKLFYKLMLWSQGKWSPHGFKAKGIPADRSLAVRLGLNKLKGFLSGFKPSRRFVIALSDYPELAIRCDPLGFRPAEIVPATARPDLVLPSRQLDYAMKYPWGPDTLNVTATFQSFTARADLLLRTFKKHNSRN